MIVTIPDSWGMLVDLLEKATGPDGLEWLRQLGLFLRKQPTWAAVVETTTTMIAKKTLTVWKTINVGGTTTEKLLQAIEAKDGDKDRNEVGDWAREVTTKPRFVISSTPSQVGLVVLTPADLGFTSNPRTDAFMTKEFCARWSSENLDGWVLELCESEDGPQLRLQYQDQPRGEVLWMAMERITVSGGDPRVFCVGRSFDGHRWLDADWARPSRTWNLGYLIVFRLRKTLPSAT